MSDIKEKPVISNIPEAIRLLRKTKKSFGKSEGLLLDKIEHIRIKISPLVDDIFEIIKNELIKLNGELDKIKAVCPDPDNCECIATDGINKACMHKDFGIKAFYIDDYLPYCPKKYLFELIDDE